MPDLQKLFIYYLELVDREDNDGQVTYVFDCAGAGYQNLDLEFVMFANRVLGAMYPLIGKYKNLISSLLLLTTFEEVFQLCNFTITNYCC